MQKLISLVEKAFLGLAGVCMIVMMLLTTFDLLSRKFLDYSIPSLYEFTEDYLMVGLVFLALGYVYSVGGHVRVTLFEPLLPSTFKLVWTKFHQILAFILFALIAVKGWEAAAQAYEYNEVSNSLLAYPLAPALCLVPIGSALLCIRILQALFNRLPLPSGEDDLPAD